MCGRYTAAKDFGELIKLVGVVMAPVPFFASRYNIATTQMAAVINKERHEPMRTKMDLQTSGKRKNVTEMPQA